MSWGWVAWVRCLLGGLLLVAALSGRAQGLPGLIASKDDEKRIVHRTHVVMLVHDPVTVATVMVDYEGPDLKQVWNKVRVGTDLPAKRRDALELDHVVLTALPSLNLPREAPARDESSVPEATDPGRCACSTPGSRGGRASPGFLTLLVLALGFRRSRQSSAEATSQS